MTIDGGGNELSRSKGKKYGRAVFTFSPKEGGGMLTTMSIPFDLIKKSRGSVSIHASSSRSGGGRERKRSLAAVSSKATVLGERDNTHEGREGKEKSLPFSFKKKKKGTGESSWPGKGRGKKDCGSNVSFLSESKRRGLLKYALRREKQIEGGTREIHSY